MARPIPCQNECGSEATWMIVNMRTGETIDLCDPCYAGFLQTMAAQLAPGPQEGAPGEAEAAATAAQGGEAPSARRPPKRRRTGDQGGEAALSAPSSPFPDAAPID